MHAQTHAVINSADKSIFSIKHSHALSFEQVDEEADEKLYKMQISSQRGLDQFRLHLSTLNSLRVKLLFVS